MEMSALCVLCNHPSHAERCEESAPNAQFSCACGGPCEHNRHPLYCSICKLQERLAAAEKLAEERLIQLRLAAASLSRANCYCEGPYECGRCYTLAQIRAALGKEP